MIKFLNPDDKKNKIKEAVKLLKKHTPKLSTNSVYGNWSSGTWNNNQATWTINANPGSTNNIYTGIFNNANNNVNNALTGGTITTSGTTTITPLTTTINPNTTITTISNPNGNSISGGLSNIAIGNGTTIGNANISLGSNTFVGYNHVLSLHKIFGEEVDLGFMPSAEIVVSLINLLGIEFWDEYKLQNDLSIYYPDAYTAIEAVLKPKRRDQKIDDIINDENK